VTTAVVQVCLDLSPTLGGLTRGIHDIAAVLGGRIVAVDSGRFSPDHATIGATVSRIATGTGPLVSRYLRLARRAHDELSDALAGADLVICHSLYRAHMPAVRRICRGKSIPYWIVAHGMLDPWVVSQRWLAKRWWLSGPGRPCLRDASRVLFSTSSEQQKAARFYRGANTTVAPWPITIPDLTGRASARAEVRRRLDVADDERLLLWLARYDQLKRPLEIVRAFASGVPAGWSLIMAGYEGDIPRASVEALARLAGGGRVTTMDAVEGSAKADLLLAADAFVSLSWRENFGYAVAEAMAYGLPVCVTPDHDLLSDRYETPFVARVPNHSLPAAADALGAFLSQDSQVLAVAGAAGREWIARTCSPEAFAMRLRSLVPMA
jgi:glycosyltransferase involved in cell wall biosynthesis